MNNIYLFPAFNWAISTQIYSFENWFCGSDQGFSIEKEKKNNTAPVI